MKARASVEAPPLVLPWRVPAVADPVATAPAKVDPTRFMAALENRLGVTLGMSVTVVAEEAAPAPPPASGFVRGDGMWLGVTVPTELVGALIGVRCGGNFAPSTAARAAGPPVATEIIAAVLAAADAAWPGGSGWEPAAGGAGATGFALAIVVAGYSFALACNIALAPVVVAPAADSRDWSRRLHAALDATPFAVRAVLHDRIVPLRDALALRVGDTLPIETRRDISLRLGDRALARGTILPDDEGGHRVTIVAVGDAGITIAKELP